MTSYLFVARRRSGQQRRLRPHPRPVPLHGRVEEARNRRRHGRGDDLRADLACGTSYLIDRYLLSPNDLGYLRTLAFIVVIAAIVQLTELVIQKTSPLLHQVLGIYLPLITTNCAVLGVPLLNVGMRHNLLESLLFGFGSASASRWRSCCSPASASGSTAPTSRSLRGTAIAMITAGLMSLAFMGFAGLDK
jgi:electron transport complex protein RnfA